MKINLILPGAGNCGGVRVAFEYMNALTEYGHDVVCYVPACGSYVGWKKILLPKAIIRLICSHDLQGRWFEKRFDLKFPFIISNFTVRDADVTIATSWLTSYWVNRLSPQKGKKVYFIQGFETWGSPQLNIKVLKSYRLAFDEHISVSTALHDRLFNEAGCKSKVVCNGVEDCFLTPVEKEIPSESIITIGIPYRSSRGDDIKNCTLGISVLYQIKKKYPHVKLVAFGFKKPSEWDEQIIFVENPSREVLVKLYAHINIFYVPSIYEGWGLPAMEAMAQKCCVIAGDSGVIKEIGRDKINCIILEDPRNKNEAINKLSELVCNPNLVSEIGEAARTSVSNMSTTKSAKRFEEILMSLLKEYK